MRNAATLINQSSGRTEYYTPGAIVEAARCVMGAIDLDPASSLVANRTVQAACIFTQEHDGLSQFWHGRVWLNHPFSRENNPKWIAKLLHEYHAGRVTQACAITFAATSEAWYRPLLNFPICFLSPRCNYVTPDGGILRGVTRGSSVVYLGDNVSRFVTVFREFGPVMMPAQVTA